MYDRTSTSSRKIVQNCASFNCKTVLFWDMDQNISKKPSRPQKMSVYAGKLACFIKTICKWGAHGIRSINWFVPLVSIRVPCSNLHLG